MQIVVYTDGSCEGNEQKDVTLRKAGIGVYFPDALEFNVSEKLPFPPCSNNRAEMYAVIKALQVIMTNKYFEKYNKSILIKTDSQFTIDLVTQWLAKWKKNGFKRSGKKAISNPDLVNMIDNTITQAQAGGYTITFQHVRAHTTEPNVPKTDQKWIDWYCNDQADKLSSVDGSISFRPADRIQSITDLHQQEHKLVRNDIDKFDPWLEDY